MGLSFIFSFVTEMGWFCFLVCFFGSYGSFIICSFTFLKKMSFIACHKIIQFLNYKWFVFEIKGYLLAVTLKTHWMSFSTQVMQWYLTELMIDSGNQDTWSINSVSVVFLALSYCSGMYWNVCWMPKQVITALLASTLRRYFSLHCQMISLLRNVTVWSKRRSRTQTE